MKKRIITVVSVVCAILLCTGIFAASYFGKSVPKNPDGTVGNTAGNLYNGGLFCENDGYVYFANPYDGFALYSMKSDETDMKKLISTEVSSINADSKYLYYYQSSTGSGTGLGYVVNSTGVFRAGKKAAENPACLDRVIGRHVVLADNDVYYTSGGEEVSLKKVSTDGKNKETLFSPDILPVSVQNSTFYYMNNDNNLHLMAYDLKTNSSYEVLAEDVYMPIIEGNMVYGIDIHDNYSLICLNISDGTKVTLDNDRTDLLNVTDSYIYYQTSGDAPQLKRIRRDGTEMEVVAEGVYSNINATSQYVYFTKFGTDTPVYKTPVSGAVNVTAFDAASQAAIEETTK